MRPNGHLGWHLTSLLKQNEEFFFLLPDQFQPVSSVVADGVFQEGEKQSGVLCYASVTGEVI